MSRRFSRPMGWLAHSPLLIICRFEEIMVGISWASQTFLSSVLCSSFCGALNKYGEPPEQWVRIMQERDENEARRAVLLLLSALLLARIFWRIV